MAKKRRPIGVITTGTGVALTVIGFFIWFTQDEPTKLFQLSNDIIGAGLFAAVFGIIIWIWKKKK